MALSLRTRQRSSLWEISDVQALMQTALNAASIPVQRHPVWRIES